MNQNILDYIDSQRVCVLAVEMPDGRPHAATVHMAHREGPLTFYFETHNTTIKSKALEKDSKTRASVVVGSDESNMKTLQMDGILELVTEEEKDNFRDVYIGKFPEKLAKFQDVNYLCLKFTPTWWRFTDWTTLEGKKIISSED